MRYVPVQWKADVRGACVHPCLDAGNGGPAGDPGEEMPTAASCWTQLVPADTTQNSMHPPAKLVAALGESIQGRVKTA